MTTLLYNMNYSKAHAVGQQETYKKVYRATGDANYALAQALETAELIDSHDPDTWRAATKIDYAGARSSLWRD